MTNSTLLELAGQAAAYSAFSSAGFIVSVLVAWFILSKMKRGTRPIGGFGKFMVLLEAVGSVPEAMVLAEATAGGRMTLSFAFSIFTLNVANTMATALDFLATKPDKRLHRVLLLLIFFSVGSLMYSVSATTFTEFLHKLAQGTYNYLSLIPMFGGVLLGTVLIWLLMYFEERVSAKERAKVDLPENIATETNEVLAPMREALEREERYLDLAISAQHENPEYHAQVVEHYSTRVTRIKELIQSFESVKNLRSSVQLPITEDAQDVIEDSVYTEMGVMEQTYLLASPNQRPVQSLNKRALQLLLIMSILLVLSVLLTFAFTPLFGFLDQLDQSSANYINSFAEGLSGGAFLATISSTMIPRIQQDAYRSHWSKLEFRTYGMFSFVIGLSFSVMLETVNL